jgi:hypothetical protein
MIMYKLDGKLINVDNVDYIEPFQGKDDVTRFVFKTHSSELVLKIPFEQIVNDLSVTARLFRDQWATGNRIAALEAQVDFIQNARAEGIVIERKGE